MENPWEKFVKRIPIERLEGSAVAALAQTRQPIAIACSGGPDSVAAAILTKAITKAPLTLLHFNHQLRGRDADKDAEFVGKLAKEMGVDFRLGVWDNANKKNELAARQARMNFLHQWEYELIVFGHHADDAVETFLIRLARGAGLEGLCAPHPVNKVGCHRHLRPLLILRKKEIVAALKACGIVYRKDHTNAENDYLRNRIRNKLLPLWQKIETRDVVAGILTSQEQLREIYETKKQVGALEAGIKPAPSRLLRGTREGSKTWEFTPDPAAVWNELHATALPLGATVFFPFGAAISARRVPAPTFEKIKKESDPMRHVWIADREKLSLRAWQPGERYSPMEAGSRKIKEILNENCGDVPPVIRALWPVVTDQENLPLWLPGARITKNAAVPASVTHVIELHFTKESLTLQAK